LLEREHLLDHLIVSWTNLQRWRGEKLVKGAAPVLKGEHK